MIVAVFLDKSSTLCCFFNPVIRIKTTIKIWLIQAVVIIDFSIRWGSMNISNHTIIYVIAFILISIVGFRIYTIKHQLNQINEQAPTRSETIHLYDFLLLRLP